mgnify:CR=1 FL=1
MTTRNILILVVLVSFGLLSQYSPDFSQHKAGETATDVIVINEKSFDPSTLNIALEKKKRGSSPRKGFTKKP